MATADITPELPTAGTWKFERNAGSREFDRYEDADEDAAFAADDDGFTLSDVFVGTAITITCATLCVALIAQTPAPVMVAVLAAGGLWFALIAGHVALRRAERRGRLAAADDYDDTEDFEDDEAFADGRQARLGDEAPTRAPLAASPMGSSAEDVRLEAEPALRPAGEDRRPRLPGGQGPAAGADAAADADAALLEGFNLGQFRPKAEPALAGDSDVFGGSMGDRLTVPSRLPAGAGEDVNEVLKRLADDISKGRRTGPRGEGKAAETRAEPKLPSGMTRAAEALRSGAAPGQARRPERAAKAPPPLPPAFPPARHDAKIEPPPMPVAKEQTAAARLAAIADALSDEQMDVFLETINGLDDYRARHYQVSVRLRLDGGEVLDSGAMVSETRGTGLLALIEAVKVSSTKRVAVQMIRRGRGGEFFSVVDGEALQTHQFSEDMETIVGGDQGLAARLVLAFSQADVRTFTPAQWDSLRDIASLGFRFSIEGITDLDMDFEKLASNGFAFAKLDAEVFLDGLPIESGRVPAADICRYLSGAGLALIVGKVADEMTRAKIMGFGALLGQGALFGAPRPVRSDVLRQGEAQPAAQ